MHGPGSWESLTRDLTGRAWFGGSLQFRLVLQKLAAIALGMRIGIRDAKRGELPFFQAPVWETGGRGGLLAEAARNAVLPLLVALMVDSILPDMMNGRVRALAAVVVGALFVFSPFLFVRALANRIWGHGHLGRRRPVGPSW